MATSSPGLRGVSWDYEHYCGRRSATGQRYPTGCTGTIGSVAASKRVFGDSGPDSMGRTPGNGWQARLQGVSTSDPDAEQPARYDNGAMTEYCGQACLAFALVAQAYGWNTARHV